MYTELKAPWQFYGGVGLERSEGAGLGVEKDWVIGQNREKCPEDLFPRPEIRDLRM